jgi:hypothetical protein
MQQHFEFTQPGDDMVFWYKRDPNAALNGMRGLSHDAKSAYNTILDLLYSRDGDLPDDERLLCIHIECRPQWWRRVRAELIAAGKIWVLPDGKLMANRVETTLKLVRNFSETQRKRVGLRWEKVMNSTAGAIPIDAEVDAEGRVETLSLSAADAASGEPAGSAREEAPAKEPAGAPRQEPRSRRKPQTPLPEDFIPANLSDSNGLEFEKFKDHARTHDRRCVDWAAAWRNWERKAAEFNQRGTGNDRRSVLAAFDRLGERLKEAGATGDYIPGSSGPEPLRLDTEKRPDGFKLISSR